MKVKAESAHSALAAEYYQIDKKKNNEYFRDLEVCKILFKEEKYTKALKKLLSLTELGVKDLRFNVEVNLLIGKILVIDNNSYDGYNLDFLGNREVGYKHLLKSLKLIDSDNLQNELVNNKFYLLKAEIYHELSHTLIRMNKPDSSVYYINKLIDLPSINSDVVDYKSKAYGNLGTINIRLENYLEAESYIKKAIEINSSMNNKVSLAGNYINLAAIYDIKEDYSKSKEVYNIALNFLENEKSLKAIQYRELLYDNIAWALYNLKDYKAYDYVVNSQEIRDSLNTIKVKKEFNKIKAENDVKKVQEKADELQSKQEQKTWIVGTTGVLISILLLYLANLYKLRQRNLSLKLSQNELRQQRRLERLNSQAQVKILNATLDGKETERKQIAEILHDNVSALLSSANMHLEATQKQYGDNIPEELQKTQQIITEASEKIRDLSHNLVSSILLKFGLEYAIKDVAKKFSNSEIKISTAISNVYRYSQDFEIKVFNIIQELVNNILKHSNAKNAYIMLEEELDAINLIVKDDGDGFDQKSDEDAGIGLNQIKARIKMMNGNFLIESSKGNGTKVIVSIPVIRNQEMALA